MALLDKDGLSYFWSKIKTKLNGKSDTGHTHDDRYYTESEIDSKLSSIPWGNVTGKPSSYTPSSHTHAISDITNLQTTLNGKANSSHKQAYTSSEVFDFTSDENTLGITPAGAKKAVRTFALGNVNVFYSMTVGTYSQDKVYKQLLPAIDQVGKICVYRITSGSISYAVSTARPRFGVDIPDSGTYKVINSVGALTFKSKYSEEVVYFNNANHTTWETSGEVAGNIGQTATVTGDATIILMRIA